MSRIVCGDALDTLKTLDAESVHCVVCSPPYWGLRDYGAEGQIGLESTPEEYIAIMVTVFREVRRVLHADGTLWLDLGDSYVGGGRAGYEGTAYGGLKASRVKKADHIHGKPTGKIPGLKPKDLCGIPWRLAFALQADGWYLRSDIIWAKPNPMPESVTDRPTKAHEYIFLLSKSAQYYYDAEAICEQTTGNAHDRGQGLNPKAAKVPAGWDQENHGRAGNGRFRPKQNPSFAVACTKVVETRNARTVWTIATQPFPGAHFATFPEELARRCILAGCPAGGTVLDPFAGAGTVGLVAQGLGREYLLIELKQEYVAMARARIEARIPLFVT